jgi:soluble lytic murein transglycosylase-like protein
VKPYLIILFLAVSFSAYVSAADCYDRAGHDYHLDPDLLRALAWQESSFHMAAIGKNPVTGHGIGLMQIDSQHIRALGELGITEQLLLHDGCMNIYTGAYYLANAIKKYGYSWVAVGAYNAGFKNSDRQARQRFRYASRIYKKYRVIKSYHRHKGNRKSPGFHAGR